MTDLSHQSDFELGDWPIVETQKMFFYYTKVVYLSISVSVQKQYPQK